jgi:hypothetical protein
MSDWREQLKKTPPKSSDAAYHAGIYRRAANAYLREQHEPHLALQQTLWDVLTGFLGKYGRLSYEEPNYDLPHFTTGPMALEPIELNRQGEEAHAIPSIQVTSHDNDLICKFFRKRTESKLRRVFPPAPEKDQEEITQAIRRTYANQPAVGSSFPAYIEVAAKYVTCNGRHDGRVDRETTPMRGAYVPTVTLYRGDLPIFPESPPPNYQTAGYTRSCMRLGRPRMPRLDIPAYYPEWGSLEYYKSQIGTSVGQHLLQREVDMTALSEVADILRTADQIALPLYPYFERTSR